MVEGEVEGEEVQLRLRGVHERSVSSLEEVVASASKMLHERGASVMGGSKPRTPSMAGGGSERGVIGKGGSGGAKSSGEGAGDELAALLARRQRKIAAASEAPPST